MIFNKEKPLKYLILPSLPDAAIITGDSLFITTKGGELLKYDLSINPSHPPKLYTQKLYFQAPQILHFDSGTLVYSIMNRVSLLNLSNLKMTSHLDFEDNITTMCFIGSKGVLALSTEETLQIVRVRRNNGFSLLRCF